MQRWDISRPGLSHLGLRQVILHHSLQSTQILLSRSLDSALSSTKRWQRFWVSLCPASHSAAHSEPSSHDYQKITPLLLGDKGCLHFRCLPELIWDTSADKKYLLVAQKITMYRGLSASIGDIYKTYMGTKIQGFPSPLHIIIQVYRTKCGSCI